jgi:hypothetical protein
MKGGGQVGGGGDRTILNKLFLLKMCNFLKLLYFGLY